MNEQPKSERFKDKRRVAGQPAGKPKLPNSGKGCFNCGLEGHLARDCPTAVKNGQRKFRGKTQQTKPGRGKSGTRAGKAQGAVNNSALSALLEQQGALDALREAVADLQEEGGKGKAGEGDPKEPPAEPPKPDGPAASKNPPPAVGGKDPKDGKEEIPPVPYLIPDGWKIEYAEQPLLFYTMSKYGAWFPLFTFILFTLVSALGNGEHVGLRPFLLAACLVAVKMFNSESRATLRTILKLFIFDGWMSLPSGVRTVVGYFISYLDWILVFFLSLDRPLVILKLLAGHWAKVFAKTLLWVYAYNPALCFSLVAFAILCLICTVFLLYRYRGAFTLHRFSKRKSAPCSVGDKRPDWMKNQDLLHQNALYTYVLYEKIISAFGFEWVSASSEFLISGELYAQCANMRHLSIADVRTESMARVESGVRKIGTVNVDRYLCFDSHDVMQMTCLVIYAHGEALKEKASLLPFPSVSLHH